MKRMKILGDVLSMLYGKYAKNAIDLAFLAFRYNRLSPRIVRSVLEVANKDQLEIFDQFLGSPIDVLRAEAAMIVAYRGQGRKVVEALQTESSLMVFMKMVKALKEVKFQEIDDLVGLLLNDTENSSWIKIEELIGLFLLVGKKDLLMPLLMGSDEKTVNRIRRLIDG